MVPQSNGGAADLRLGLGAYAKIFGLEYEHDHIFNPEDHARFHLRILGYNVQNTNLTFQTGIRFRPGAPNPREAYLGLSETIYLHKYFGIYSLYRYYLSTSGHRAEFGPFIDFGPLRLFGNYVYEEQNANGWVLGGQLFL